MDNIKGQHQGTPNLWLSVQSGIAFDPSLLALPIIPKQNLESMPANGERERNVKVCLTFARYVETKEQVEMKGSRDVGGRRRPGGCRDEIK